MCACSQPGSAAHHREIGVREIDASRRFVGTWCLQSVRVLSVFVGGQCAFAGEAARCFGDAPCFAAIKAARLHGSERFISVAAVKTGIRFVVADGESDDDLVIPCPDTVVCGPTGIPARLAIKRDMFHSVILLKVRFLHIIAGLRFFDARNGGDVAEQAFESGRFQTTEITIRGGKRIWENKKTP